MGGVEGVSVIVGWGGGGEEDVCGESLSRCALCMSERQLCQRGENGGESGVVRVGTRVCNSRQGTY